MRSNLVIFDGFLSNPMEARQAALTAQYEQQGNYPGTRTPVTGPYFDLAKAQLELMLPGKIKEMTSYFQFTTSRERSWIHSDWEEWAAVLFLTPDAPASAGTGFFRHKETGKSSRLNSDVYQTSIHDRDSQDLTKWDKIGEAGNVFNRLILYPGDLFHMSLDYFGQNINDGRLFQVFFINLGD